MKAISKTRIGIEKTLVITLFFIFLTSFISATTAASETNYPADNFFGRIISSIQEFIKTGSFTVYGREMGCDTNPASLTYLKNYAISDLPRYYFFKQEDTCGGDSFFVDFYRGKPGNDQYLSEYYYSNGQVYVTDGNSKGSLYISKFTDQNNPFYNEVGLSCDAGEYWDKKCYVEVYCCSQGACTSDSDCGNKECSKTYQISELFPALGVCQEKYLVLPTYKTSVYQCNSNGSASLLKQVSYGDKNFCNIEGKNNYITIGGTASGVCYAEDKMPCVSNTAVTTVINTTASKSIPLTDDEFNQATARMIVTSMCQLPADCDLRENYSVSCITSDSIKNINVNAMKQIKTSDNDFRTKLCNGLSFNIADLSTVGLTKIVSWLGGGGYLYSWICSDKDVTTAQISGTCRATEENSFLNFFKSLAFFDITGDGKKDYTDGMIIFFVVIIILFLIIPRRRI